MAFVDDVVVLVKAGDGGRGCVSFQHRRFQPKGGPDGGNGGNGGNVYLRATLRLTSLEPFRYVKSFRAESGKHGEGNDKDGRSGRDTLLDVPLGTVVIDQGNGQILKELLRDGETLLVARGGRGGKGNKFFAGPTNRAPRIAGKGSRGEEKRIRLILKTMADVGLVGFPNAGKSTLLAALTNARPRIAEFPFTTLNPHVGVMYGTRGEPIMMADIPGLIEGASEGKGLGHLFLRHIERTRLLVILLDLTYQPSTHVLEDLDILLGELSRYNPDLLKRPRLIVVNKIDLEGSSKRYYKDIQRAMEARKEAVLAISAMKGIGLSVLRDRLTQIIKDGLRYQ